MSALAAPLFAAAISSIASAALGAALAPDIPEPDTGGTASKDFNAAADEEARRRRRSTSQLLNPGAVGAPQARVGTPTIVLGG
jgi:hypothetical protein